MLKRALIIPDVHRPFHHQRAYDLMMEVGAFFDPHEIVLLGDYADCYSISSHEKHPKVFNLLEDELVDVLAGLSELDQVFKKQKKVFLLANHCARLERYLINKAPALFGVTSIESLFEFKKRPNWKVVPYIPSQRYQILNSKLYARHEPLAPTPKGTAKEAGCSIVYGHVHKIERGHNNMLDGTDHIAFCPGWLGDKKQENVFNYVKKHHQWQLGFSVVYIDIDSGMFYPEIVHILEHDNGKVSACVHGKIFKG